MSMFGDINTLNLLKDLLKDPNNGDSSSDDDCYSPAAAGVHRIGPSDLVSSSKKATLKEPETKKENPYAPIDNSQATPAPTTIEEWETQQLSACSELLEHRQCPRHNISYRQAVTSEDVFLQMSNKTTSTSSCEDMLITVDMPDETVGIEDMILSVEPDKIDLQTPVYRLRLPLPHPVDPDRGKATWDSDDATLKITLRMKREYDLVNF